MADEYSCAEAGPLLPQSLPCGTVCQRTTPSRRLHIVRDASSWVTPTSLQDLLSMVDQYKSEPYVFFC